MVEFNKSVFDNTFKAISSIQDNSISMLTAFMDKVPGLPSEREKAITDWVAAFKKSRDDFKTAADNKYEEVANYFMKKEDIGSSRMKK